MDISKQPTKKTKMRKVRERVRERMSSFRAEIER